MSNISLSIKHQAAQDLKSLSFFFNILADKMMDAQTFASIFLSHALYYNYSVGLGACSEATNFQGQDELVNEMFNVSRELSINPVMRAYLKIISKIIHMCMDKSDSDGILCIDIDLNSMDYSMYHKDAEENELDTLEQMLHNAGQ